MPREVEAGDETPAQARAREKAEAKAEAAAEAKRNILATPPPPSASPVNAGGLPVSGPIAGGPKLGPTTPSGSADADAFFKSLDAGEAMGNDLFAPGSLGRLTDPNAAATAELLARLKGNLGGMDEATQNAARENAILQINDQANNQLGQITNSAAGRGLRGGVVAGAQQPVLGAAASAYSGALRDLAGKVSQSQQDASTLYNSALNNAADIDKGIQTSNNAAADSEFQGRLETPFSYANGMTTYKAGDVADTLGRQAAGLGGTPKKSSGGVKGGPFALNGGFDPMFYDKYGAAKYGATDEAAMRENLAARPKAGSSKSRYNAPIRNRAAQ
jgi:hypothetical protein